MRLYRGETGRLESGLVDMTNTYHEKILIQSSRTSDRGPVGGFRVEGGQRGTEEGRLVEGGVVETGSEGLEEFSSDDVMGRKIVDLESERRTFQGCALSCVARE